MPRPTLRRTSRLGILLALAVLLIAAAACTPQNEAQDLMNADRNANGLASLPSEATIFQKAQAWSEQMARDGKISHSTLSAGLPPGWKSAGENVACGSSLANIEASLMNSAGHRANILGNWTHAANGVAQGTCWVNGRPIQNAYFVTQVFIRL